MTLGVTRNRSFDFFHHRVAYQDEKKSEAEHAKQHSLLDNCKRVAVTSLPFFSLYKPFSMPIALASGGLRASSCATKLVVDMSQHNSKELPQDVLQTTIAVLSLAGTVFAHPIGMLVSTSYDLLEEVQRLTQHLQQGHYQQAMESCANIVNNSLYLALFLHGGLEISIASLALQISLGLYHSQSEFKKGNFIEAGGHLLMAMIRGSQLADQVQSLQFKRQMEALIQKMKEVESKKSLTVVSIVGIASVNLSEGNGLLSKKRTNHMMLSGAKKSLNAELALSQNSDTEFSDALTKYSNNPKNWPVLNYAVFQNDEAAVRVLLKYGFDPNGRSPVFNSLYNAWEKDRGESPLEIAYSRKNLKIMSCLMDFGANPCDIPAVKGKSHYLAYDHRALLFTVLLGYFNSYEFAEEAMNLFLSKKIDLNAPIFWDKQFGYKHRPLFIVLNLNLFFGTLNDLQKKKAAHLTELFLNRGATVYSLID